MEKVIVSLVVSCLLLVGCDSLRFAPSEAQKQNAWLHHRTTSVAAQAAKGEAASEKLQAVTMPQEKRPTRQQIQR